MHQRYPPPDCCLCNARERAEKAEADLAALESVVEERFRISRVYTKKLELLLRGWQQAYWNGEMPDPETEAGENLVNATWQMIRDFDEGPSAPGAEGPTEGAL